MDLDQYLEKMITNTIVIWIRFIYKCFFNEIYPCGRVIAPVAGIFA